ncbi:xylan glycosyltransferase MUCI21-like [Argentina anserina]|uniref:xylan glycosyltransferase MUCI21-like n=1 Tax=Argentina anserina TaxID=57926 RepID=UPI002176750F|nr:xylan glycosyltransferase MUCI21-like [Potentilla anserina]
MKKIESKTAIMGVSLLVMLFVWHINLSENLRLDFELIRSLAATPKPDNFKRLSPRSNTSGGNPIDSTSLQSQSSTKIICNRSDKFYDFCFINGPTVLNPTTSTLFVTDSTEPTVVEKIRPYPRKHENSTMSRIQEFTLTSGPPGPKCQVQHNAPAIVFSAGGYTGNFFHDFNDGFIPLYIIVNSILYDQVPVLVISKARDWWLQRYSDLLQVFSENPIINLENDTATHCFRSATVGLISHGFLTINHKMLKTPKTLPHFHAILGKAFGQRQSAQRLYRLRHQNERPRMVLISRTVGVGRAILNQEEVIEVAERIGFEVVVYEPSSRTDLHAAYDLLNNSHAVVGVHGAALTHLLFMRPGTVFMQIVPLGTKWPAKVCYEDPSRAMGLQYIDYRITAEESSLVETYSKDDIVVKDPAAKIGSDWSVEIMKIYLKEQNVRLDLDRFSWFLKAAYDKAKKFMEMEG